MLPLLLQKFPKNRTLKKNLTHKTFSFCFSVFSYSFVPEKAKWERKEKTESKKAERGYRGGVITIKIYEIFAKIQITLHLLQFLLLRNDTTVQLFSSFKMCAVEAANVAVSIVKTCLCSIYYWRRIWSKIIVDDDDSGRQIVVVMMIFFLFPPQSS